MYCSVLLCSSGHVQQIPSRTVYNLTDQVPSLWMNRTCSYNTIHLVCSKPYTEIQSMETLDRERLGSQTQDLCQCLLDGLGFLQSTKQTRSRKQLSGDQHVRKRRDVSQNDQACVSQRRVWNERQLNLVLCNQSRRQNPGIFEARTRRLTFDLATAILNRSKSFNSARRFWTMSLRPHRLDSHFFTTSAQDGEQKYECAGIKRRG